MHKFVSPPPVSPAAAHRPELRRRSRPKRWVITVLAGLLSLSLLPAGAVAQADDMAISGLSVEQEDGFAILTWDHIDGATDYQIERTPVDAADEPTGPGVIVGLWRPDRVQFTLSPPDSPSFADAGFEPGGRYTWRVRARFGTDPQPYSDPVSDDTRPHSGPDEFLTQWETSGAAQWTSHENEIDFADRLAEASGRMRVETIGHTVLGRRIDMYILGHPRPLATAAAISRSPTVMLNCNVHGNEPAGREACLIATRDLALSNDPRVIDLLTNATVLVVPAINGDGRAANTRGNSTGQDLNRDHSLIRQPETFAFAEALRDYTPDAAVDGHEFGNNNTGDLPLLWPRHRNVAPDLHDEGMAIVREFFFDNAAVDGWWTVPYPFPSVGAGLGQETILRNTLGLKNTLGMLLESRVQPGPTRPNAGGNQGIDNIRRRVYSHLWTYQAFLDYHRHNRSDVYDAVVSSRDFNLANTGPVYLDGAYDAPGNIPIADPPTQILDPAPCGYALTPDQYTQDQPDGPTVQERLDGHGIRAEVSDDRVLVRLNQPLRGLIPLLLDPDATEAPLIDGERLDDCGPPVCPDTIVLAGQDSGVGDRPADDVFCASLLFDDERPWPNRGAFVQHVTSVSNDLRAAGVLSARERAQLISAAGRS